MADSLSPDAEERQRIMLLGQHFEKLQAQIEEYRKSGEYELAISLCVEIVRHQEPELKPYQVWAQEQLHELRQMPQKIAQADQAALRLADQLLDIFDFEGTIRLIEEIPETRRTREHDELLQEARKTLHDLGVLEARLERATRLSNIGDMIKYANRILELHPNHFLAQEALRTARANRSLADFLNFDALGAAGCFFKMVWGTTKIGLVSLLILGPLAWLLLEFYEWSSAPPQQRQAQNNPNADPNPLPILPPVIPVRGRLNTPDPNAQDAQDPDSDPANVAGIAPPANPANPANPDPAGGVPAAGGPAVPGSQPATTTPATSTPAPAPPTPDMSTSPASAPPANDGPPHVLQTTVPLDLNRFPADHPARALLSDEWAWSQPTPLESPINSRNWERHPFLSRDGLELYFESLSRGIAVVSRGSSKDSFGDPVTVRARGGLVGGRAYFEVSPSLTGDGLTMVFTSNRSDSVGGYDIRWTRRSGAGDNWGPDVPLPSTINSVSNESTACISGDGLTLLFSSDRPGGAGLDDLYFATRPDLNSGFEQARALAAPINSPYIETDPYLSPDGTILLFSSSRPDGLGGLDLYASVRVTADEPFSEPVHLGAFVNSSSDDTSPTLSPDGTELIFASPRPGGAGSSDVWTVRRTRR